MAVHQRMRLPLSFINVVAEYPLFGVFPVPLKFPPRIVPLPRIFPNVVFIAARPFHVADNTFDVIPCLLTYFSHACF